MGKTLASLLQSAITLHGDPNRPIPPGTAFATIPPKSEFKQNELLKNIPYPPILAHNPGCSFVPDTGSLASGVWGKLVFSSEGIRVRPCWRMTTDQMQLTLEVDPVDFQGKPVTIERILINLPNALEGLERDLNIPAIQDALKRSEKTNKTTTIQVAQGTLPGEGQDALLDLKFEADNAVGTVRKDGSMDFKERSVLYSVKEGDMLGTLHPAVNGTPGYDLFGNEIQPGPVERISITVGQGVESVDLEDGGTLYRATREGVARYRNDRLEVIDFLEIRGDVDYNTGNIHAENSSVHIRGDVKCGFQVACSGDVVIDGVVEEADIIAGGLVIAGGVIMNGKNRIEAQGDVSAHFFRNAVVNAGGDVRADQEISQCMITAGGKVTVLSDSGGVISGGHIISGDTIHARDIGNKSHLETIVEIRIQSPTFEKLDNAKKELKEELARLDRAVGVDFDLSSLMSAPEEDRRILAELIKVRQRLQADVREIEDSKKRMIEESQQLMASKRIIAERRAHSGTEVIICGKSHKVNTGMDGPRYALDIEEQTITWT